MVGDMELEKMEQKIDIEEQETMISIDYAMKEIVIYSTRASVVNRMIRQGYEPTKTFYLDNEPCGAEWRYPTSMIGKFVRTGLFSYNAV